MSFIIGVCGGSCGGKTTICDIIKAKLGDNVAIIKQDSYYKGGGPSTNFDHPDAIEFSFMIDQLKKLSSGTPIKEPIYDFETHSRKKETQYIKPAKIIIVDGILIFSKQELLDLFDLRLYVDADMDTRYRRRLNRGIKEWHRNIDEIDMRWDRDVKPCHLKYVEPSKCHAHIIINNDKTNSLKQRTQMIQIEIIETYIEDYIRKLTETE
uniref:uridine/cytidine kinase n=1 Tax=Mimivirus LCMiAC01 TaxID=2506608 RepID=A0A481Z0B2_9VIRU|nr:MAG: phosphoribulokinase / uridine kinase family protein [Mimivirus LCMiAC01]